LSIPASKVRHYQQKFSRLSNIYLIQPLKYGFNPLRSSASEGYDWDLLGLISEIRRSIYGGLDERDIKEFIWEGRRLKTMQGLMGFYCILEDSKRLKVLDGWLVNHVRRTMVHRNKILSAKYGATCPTPSNAELIKGSWLNLGKWSGDPDEVEPGMPSFVRGWRAARKHYLTFGLEDVQPPEYGEDSGFGSILHP
jgi:hypothetical protein